MEADGAVTCKLGQKIRDDARDPARVRLTNLYLSEEEHALLATLPAAVLIKTRRRLGPFVVDEFGGSLTGLILAEAEVADLEAPIDVSALPSIREVTYDDRYSGGALALAVRPPG